jgi:hypothetical protein
MAMARMVAHAALAVIGLEARLFSTPPGVRE